MSDPFLLPRSQDTLHVEENVLTQQRSPSTYPITRTVAIIKPHALPHRFEIEHRIQEASFEIVKERRMEFDTETDPDTLYELFGEDAASFSEGPVWVYVLERRRAVEVWATLMGNADPEIARVDAPHSLRALFDKDISQNAVMGSPDTQTAELQIASIFVSSPPFPTTELPAEDGDSFNYDSVRSLDSSKHAGTDEGYAHSTATNPSTVGGSRPSLSGKPAFRARPVPATNASPTIVPRTTRAAALRAGTAGEKSPAGPRTPPSKEQLKKTFENVPGHKRSETIAVASTAAPAISPRMTRAASLRLGLEPSTPPRRESAGVATNTNTFEGVPGHKRKESIVVASVKPPSVSPRLNKSAELRQRGEQGPPSSFMCTPLLFISVHTPDGLSPIVRGATTPKLPAGVARTTSTSSNTSSPKTTSSPAAPPARSSSRASLSTTPSRYAVKRPSSVLGTPPAAANAPDAPAIKGDTAAEPDTPSKPATRPPRPSSVASIHSSPSIPPRTNRSAVLRAAKQEAENLAAAAAAKKKNRVSRAAPSSFKPIAV
ncbi:hypothetical protein C0995_006614 [Termitomyces sp. Mi166|nr:hypothetical protein C0995_006614 [Termitomyces sp. Mi166\